MKNSIATKAGGMALVTLMVSVLLSVIAPTPANAVSCVYNGTHLVKHSVNHERAYLDQANCIGGYGRRLIMQTDGNLVLYKMNPLRACWASNTVGNQALEALYQDNGDLVIVNYDHNVMWRSGVSDSDRTATVDINSAGTLYIGHTAYASCA